MTDPRPLTRESWPIIALLMSWSCPDHTEGINASTLGIPGCLSSVARTSSRFIGC